MISNARMTAVVFVALAFAAATPAGAVVLTQPDNFANTSNGELPATVNSSESSVGSGAWQADGDLTDTDDKQHLIYLQGGQPGPLAGGSKNYPSAGVNPRLLLPASQSVTIDDIRSISWDTKSATRADWFVDIFTKPDDVDDDSGWYGKQFDLTAGNAASTSASGGFKRHTLDSSGGAVFDGTSFPPAEPLIDLDALKSDYGDEELMFIAVGTGTNYDRFSGLLDNFQFDYDYEGTSFSRQVDFEASVPLPSSLTLSLVGLLGLVVRRRLAR